MKHYASGQSATGAWYVYRTKRYKVLARDISKRDAQLIARALNALADEDDRIMGAVNQYRAKGTKRRARA